MNANFTNWLRQPSTVVGIAAAIATVAHTLAAAITHQMSWPVALGGAVFALAAMGLPDNSAAQRSARQLTEDLVTAAVRHRLAQAAPELLGDGASLVQAIAAAAPKAAPVAVLALLGLGLSACQPAAAPATATVAQAAVALTAADQAALRYVDLPTCPALPACSDPATVVRIKAAAAAAYGAVLAAQASQAQGDLGAAIAAVGALSAAIPAQP